MKLSKLRHWIRISVFVPLWAGYFISLVAAVGLMGLLLVQVGAWETVAFALLVQAVLVVRRSRWAFPFFIVITYASMVGLLAPDIGIMGVGFSMLWTTPGLLLFRKSRIHGLAATFDGVLGRQPSVVLRDPSVGVWRDSDRAAEAWPQGADARHSAKLDPVVRSLEDWQNGAMDARLGERGWHHTWQDSYSYQHGPRTSVELQKQPHAVPGPHPYSGPIDRTPNRAMLPGRGPYPETPWELAFALGDRRLAKSAVRQTPAVASEDLTAVDCTVFAPAQTSRNDGTLVQVFLHSPESKQQAEAIAVQHDPTATQLGYRCLTLGAAIGTVFLFQLDIEDLEVVGNSSSLTWTGAPQAATFALRTPKRCRLGAHHGTVRVSMNGVPVGRIDFRIEVVRQSERARPRPTGDEACLYRRCFCSYSSMDRSEALKRVQGLRAAGLETFVDVMTLRPGESWSDEIFSAIDASDLFIVIWSTHARKSKWVRKEARYALSRFKRHRRPDFRPIPIEGPPIPSVPRPLRAIHFNDELLQLIRANELTSRQE